MKYSLRIATLLSAILIALIDFVVTREFHIESSYLVLLLLILGLGLVVQLNNLPRVMNRLIIGAVALLSASNFYWFFISLLGYRFLGSSIPVIWYAAFIVNLLMGWQAVSSLISYSKHGKKRS